jgi:hypothetical protein
VFAADSDLVAQLKPIKHLAPPGVVNRCDTLPVDDVVAEQPQIA